jgi:hypothetical protein
LTQRRLYVHPWPCGTLALAPWRYSTATAIR